MHIYLTAKIFTSLMFKLNEKNEVDRRILQSDYVRSSPAKVSTMNTPNSQNYIQKPKEFSVVSFLNGFFD